MLLTVLSFFLLFLLWNRSQVLRWTECNAEVHCKEECGCTSLNLPLVKNCEGSEILLYLQATQLACHNFMDAEGRHGAVGLDSLLQQ